MAAPTGSHADFDADGCLRRLPNDRQSLLSIGLSEIEIAETFKSHTNTTDISRSPCEFVDELFSRSTCEKQNACAMNHDDVAVTNNLIVPTPPMLKEVVRQSKSLPAAARRCMNL